MPGCTHPHLEGEGETERVRDREFDPVARNSIRGDDETDSIFHRSLWAVHPRSFGSLLDSRNENGV